MTDNTVAVPSGTVPSSPNRVVDFALSVAAVAAFAIPGVGIFIAAGLTGIRELWDSTQASTPVLTAEQIETIVVGAVDARAINDADEEVRTAISEYVAYIDSDNNIKVDIPGNLDAAIRDHPTDPGVNFYDRLHDWVYGQDLLNNITKLCEASANTGPNSPEVIALPNFLRAAGFYLLAYKTYAIVAKKGGVLFDVVECGIVRKEVDNWTKYVTDQISSITKQIDARVAQVTPLTTYELEADDLEVMQDAGITPDQWSLVYFADSGPPVSNFDPPARGPQDTSLSWAPDSNRVASVWGTDETPLIPYRNTYVEKLRGALNAEFGSFDLETTCRVLQKWDVTGQSLDYMINHDGEFPPPTELIERSVPGCGNQAPAGA